MICIVPLQSPEGRNILADNLNINMRDSVHVCVSLLSPTFVHSN